MNIQDIIDSIAEDVIKHGADLDGAIDSFINTAEYVVHTEILDEIGDVDLSEPMPDPSQGWRAVRAQLAYNALYRAVSDAIKSGRYDSDDADTETEEG